MSGQPGPVISASRWSTTHPCGSLLTVPCTQVASKQLEIVVYPHLHVLAAVVVLQLALFHLNAPRLGARHEGGGTAFVSPYNLLKSL